jgi:hypothetical protein
MHDKFSRRTEAVLARPGFADHPAAIRTLPRGVLPGR